MALSNNDIQRIGQEFRGQFDEINKTMEKMIRLTEDHEYTLYGIDRKNGLATTVREQSDEISDLQTFKAKVVGYASGVSGVVSLLVTIIIKLLGGK